MLILFCGYFVFKSRLFFITEEKRDWKTTKKTCVLAKPSYLSVLRKIKNGKNCLQNLFFHDYYPRTLVSKKRVEITLVTCFAKPASKMGPLTKKRKNAISPKLKDFVRGEAPSSTSEQQEEQEEQEEREEQEEQEEQE